MTTPSELNYKVGESTPWNAKIVFIYGQSTDVVVFKDDKGKVHWETASDRLTPTQSIVHRHHERLNARALSCLPKGKLGAIREELAQALFLGLSEPNEEKALQHFEACEARLAQEAQNRARHQYVFAGTVGGVLLAIIWAVAATYSSPEFAGAFAAAMAGSVGAWTSILQRGSRLELGPFETPLHLRFQGALRILIGTVFGGIAYAAVHAGLLLPSADSNPWAMLVITFVAGFSERLIPELINRMESQESAAALKPPGGAG